MPPKKEVPAALQKWNAHLTEFRKQHPEMSLREAMVAAKATYKR